jgi:tetratricopeptide (TPR) repeat protein
VCSSDLDLAQKALSLDASNVEARRLLVQVYNLRRQYQLAIIEAERVIAVNPNDAQSYAIQGVALVWAGQVDGAILSLETALRFDPNMEPKLSWNLGLAYYLKSRFNDSIAVMEKNIGRRLDNAFDYMLLAAGYAQMNRPDEAAIAAASVLRLSPFFQIKDFGPQFRDPADAARVAVGLRKAGLK